MAPVVQVYTLGRFRVLVAGHELRDQVWRRKTARQLFKVLLSRPGRRMTRDEVIELFWPESGAEAASSNLRSTVHALRQALERTAQGSITEVVSSDHSSVWLPADDKLWSDADAFAQKVSEAWRSPNPLPLLQEASTLYMGEYLPDDLCEDWTLERREILKRSWTELQFGLARALETHSDVNAAIQPLERLLRADACDERAALELMKLLARHGRRADALRTYQRLAKALADQLGVQPSGALLALYSQITAGETSAAFAASFRCAYPFPEPRELIGRTAELGVLEEVLARGRTGGQVALIGAPAGTGKSALAGRIVKLAQTQGILVLAGGCYEEQGGVPFGPFHDALADFLLAQPPEHLRTELGGAAADLAQVVPELRYQLDLDDAGSRASGTDRARVMGAIHSFLRRHAENGPVVICLEDLHVADEATIHLLHYLARQTRRIPLTFIGTYRYDELRPDEPLAQALASLARERLASDLRLRPLMRDDTQRLATVVLDGPTSDSLVESVFETTGGNPLFIEQLLLALAEGSLLQVRAATWHTTGEIEGSPPIVREVIASRLAQLPSSCRETLAMASVLGRTFDYRVLNATLELDDEAALLRDLDTAIGVSLLQETANGFAFRHILLRDAVYWSMTAPQRILLHDRAGRSLERLYGLRADDHASELAHHFSRGGSGDTIRAKALNYSLVAGRRAEALSAHREALGHFKLACELIGDGVAGDGSTTPLEALEGRGRAERQLAMWPNSVSTFRQVLAQSENASQRARARAVLVSALLFHDPKEALQEIENGLADLAPLADDENLASVRLHLQSLMALVWFLHGQYEKVLRLGQQMRDVATLLDPLSLSRAHSVIAWGHLGRGHMPDAEAQYALALAEAERSGNKVQIAAVHVNLGALQCLSGKFETARAHIESCIDIYRQSTSDLNTIYPLVNRARVWLAQGDLSMARADAEEALGLANEARIRFAAECHAMLGAVSTLQCQWEDAKNSFEHATAIHREVGNVAGETETLLGLGWIHEQLGDRKRAQDLYSRAMEVAKSADVGPPIAAVLRHAGRLNTRVGRYAHARGQLERALEVIVDEGMEETLEFAPVLVALGDLEVCTGNLAEGVRLFDQATTVAKTYERRIEVSISNALAHLEMSEIERAQVHALRALDLASRLGAPRLLGLAHRTVGKVAASRKDQPQAIAAFRLALDFLERCGVSEECELVRADLHSLESSRS